MDFVLDNWDTLVHKTLDPENGIATSLDRETVCGIICQSANEQQVVRNRLITLVVNEGKTVDKRQLIHIIQTMLIRMADKLYHYQKCQKLSDEVKCICNKVNQHLLSTLEYIEDFFSYYFNRDEKVPIAYLFHFREQTKIQLELLKERMKKAKVPSTLGNLVVNHFLNTTDSNETAVSYNEILSQKEFMNTLLSEGHLRSEESITETLFYLNFNSRHYVSYITDKLRRTLDGLSHAEEKIAALHLEQKRINQYPTKKSYCLSPSEPSLKEQLKIWVDEEIKYLSIALPPKATQQQSENPDHYIHLAFKGPEIYLLHKAFVDSGGAPTESYKSLLEKTCRSISNKNQKGFSAESLQKASDKVEPVSKENVKRFLQRMIRNIDSYD